MPYENQRATGEALIALQQSRLFEEFKGKIKEISSGPDTIKISPTDIPESTEQINKVVAIDGSLVTETVQNGFPGAEASLIQLALVFIDLSRLESKAGHKITPPSVFNEMDSAKSLQAVLPGRNIVSEEGLAPKDFFRDSIYEALQGKVVQAGHETLLETFEALVQGRNTAFKCSNFEECGNRVKPRKNKGLCDCYLSKTIYSTDQLRFHERFNETGPNGEAHGEVMRFLEIILLLNVLRYFVSSDKGIKVLTQIAFILDGPLAVFGQFASIAPRVKDELRRISDLCFSKTGKQLLLFSITKTGQFVEHFSQLDFDQQAGPDKKFPERTTLLPDIQYIHKAIVYRPPDAKEWGKDTYFGRIVLYKSRSGQKMVVNTPKLTDSSEDLSDTSLNAYPRLPVILKITDQLSTYLFEGGFIPIVRAHSHAAIPLKLGGEILQSLFDDEV